MSQKAVDSKLMDKVAKPLCPVNVRAMRHVYRDIIAASAAGEGVYRVLASIRPIRRVDVASIAWTGSSKAPLAIRPEQSWGHDALELTKTERQWMRFSHKSAMVRLVNAEYKAYYPDAGRSYSSIRQFGENCWKLVIGKNLISVVFDNESPFTAMKQQINSLLDMISQALLDSMLRQLRFYQDQIVFALGQDKGTGLGGGQMENDVRTYLGEGSDAAEHALELLDRNARLFASFFDLARVDYLLAPDISKLVLFRQVLEPVQAHGKLLHRVQVDLGPFMDSGDFEQLRVLEFPLPWGSNGEDDKFFIRLYSFRPINEHVRKALMLGQALLKCKEQVEALFDRRYREYRIYQDNRHFERCKLVRNHADDVQTIRQYLRDSVAEYEEEARTLPRDLVFPQYAAWEEKLGSVLKNTKAEILEFRDGIRLRDLREYTYLNMKVPSELRALLLSAMDPAVYIQVETEHPVLARMSDVPANIDLSQFERW